MSILLFSPATLVPEGTEGSGAHTEGQVPEGSGAEGSGANDINIFFPFLFVLSYFLHPIY